ncbi:Uncharacterized protein SCF082_LOCUS17564 [Durusdinium trenchii]|uniref:Uncharacterized protein n=1 Tax=Durusdinium trenchii TaxID=1381693 RepID=A0ABP0KKS7_9DINO
MPISILKNKDAKGKEEEDEEDEDEEDDEDEAEEGSDGEETGPGDSESEEETEEEPEETPEEKSTGKKRKREDEASSSKKSSEKAEEKTEAKGKKGLEKAEAFKRWINNKKKCPAKIIAACKNEETRNQIFNDYVELGRKNTSQVEARFNLTIQDPEFPDDEGELLYWVLVEFNLDDIKELKRITQLELQGSLDPEGVKAFVEVTADTPIEKAQALVNRILKDINSCREFAFKLRPLAMSTDLIDQLSACAVKLGRQAELLQQKIKSKQNKNRHYVDIIREVDEITAMAKGRLELAKALIRASEKSSKPKKKAAENPGDAVVPLYLYHSSWRSSDPAGDRFGKEKWSSFPELGSMFKASIVKYMQFWASDYLAEERDAAGPGGDLRLFTMYSFAKFQLLLDIHGDFFGIETKKEVIWYARNGLMFYQHLTALDRRRTDNRRCYKLTPKFHSLYELTVGIDETGRNPRFDHCYQDEDLMRHLGAICSRTHPATMDVVALGRYKALLEHCTDF